MRVGLWENDLVPAESKLQEKKTFLFLQILEQQLPKKPLSTPYQLPNNATPSQLPSNSLASL